MTVQNEQPALTPPRDPEVGRRLHRRQVRREILWPMFGVGALFVVAVVLVALATRLEAAQIGAVADVMVTLLVLLPMVICMLPLYILLMLAVFGMSSLHAGSERQLNRFNDLVYNVSARTMRFTGTVNQRVAKERLRVAGTEGLMNQAFDDNKVDGLIEPEGKTTDEIG